MTQLEIHAVSVAEFDVIFARPGLAVRSERRDSILAGYADPRVHASLPHGSRGHLVEPANFLSKPTKADG